MNNWEADEVQALPSVWNEDKSQWEFSMNCEKPEGDPGRH